MYQENGAIRALLDIYKKSLNELKTTIEGLCQEELINIIDRRTNDEDCRSIQTILTHIVQSGYTYVIEIRKWLGEDIAYQEKKTLTTVEAYKLALNEMFDFTEQLFIEYPDITLVTYDISKKIYVRWGQTYDVEQLMQHAIMHVLRHQRQIEKFKRELSKIKKLGNN